VKRRNASSEIADGAQTENNSLGPETAGDAPSTDGDDTNSTEPRNGTSIDFANHTEPHLEAPAQTPVAQVDETRALLEERIRRLEEALARLHEHSDGQAAAAQPSPPPPPPPMALVAPVARIVPPPAPITTAPAEAASSFLFHVGKQMLTTTPFTSVAQPAHPTQETTFGAGLRWTWLFFDSYAELRAILRMFVDPRYRMSWTSRLVPLALAVLLATSHFWAPGTSLPGIGPFIDKLIDLPLAFLFFKVLSHEARRYRQTSPDLPIALRLPPEQ
jgi:hypothetical protein